MKNEDYVYRSYLTICSAIYHLSSRFKNLTFPIRNNFNYDILGDKDNKIFRIKVIYTNCKQKSGVYVANIRKSGGYRDKKENKMPFDSRLCDYLYIETPDAKYLIPSSDIATIRSITLSQYEDCRISSVVEQRPVKPYVEGSSPSFDE